MSRSGREPARARALLRGLGQVLAWIVILAVAAAITVAVLIPRIGGATPYAVLTGSMQPKYPPGTLVVVKPADPEDIGVGAVVTYQIESGKPAVVTHRVVTVARQDGEPVFQTRGDANNAVDPGWVRPIQLRGKLWYAVPYLGYANTAIQPGHRQWAVYATAGLLFIYATYMFASALRDKRPQRRRAHSGREVTI